VGLPDAILFLRISQVGVFQQPHLITSIYFGYTTPYWSFAYSALACFREVNLVIPRRS
jgi:hypothetical protein